MTITLFKSPLYKMHTSLFIKIFPIQNDPVVYAIPLFILLIAIEIYLDWKEKKALYEKKDAIASITMGLGSVLINSGMKILAFSWFSWLYQYHLLEIGTHWWSWLLLLFADDFTFYWHHRWSHEVRVLWAAHVNHHSSQHYNLSTALRQSWVEYIYKYIWWSWLPLLGFEPLYIMIMISLNLIYQFWVHTEFIYRFPRWFEMIFNTPSHHRVHHAMNPLYLDRNHAGILIIWDKIFGTYQEENESIKPTYGITVNIHTFNPIEIATHEYKNLYYDIQRAPTWLDKFKYIFYPPGWSHDGSTKTAKELRDVKES